MVSRLSGCLKGLAEFPSRESAHKTVPGVRGQAELQGAKRGTASHPSEEKKRNKRSTGTTMSSSSPSPSPSSPSSPNQQPIHRPAQWQLSGDALGYLIVLSPNDLIQPQARLALKTQKTIIGSSAELSTICLEDPMIDPVHLIINIHTESKHNRVSSPAKEKQKEEEKLSLETD